MKQILFILIISSQLFACKNHNIADEKVNNYTLEFYYQDSINVDVGTCAIAPALVQSKSIFDLENGQLFVKNFSSIESPEHYININGIDKKIRLKFWINGKYSLEDIGYDNRRALLTKEDTTFYFVGDRLCYSVGDMSVRVDCGRLMPPDGLYNQMVAENGVYAVRIDKHIYVSCDLKNWDDVFDKKRGLTDIMALVKNRKTNHMELVFGDYTAGSERVRHYVYKYNFTTGHRRIVKTFYTEQENIGQALTPYARHIHVIMKDPYTGDLYLGTGDSDGESNIYRSTDDGETFELLGGRSQIWRTLSFIFTENSIFWNTDSHEPQYLTRISRSQLATGRVIKSDELVRFPLINSACWSNKSIATPDGNQIYVMNSSGEGALYDDWCRTYGIIIKNDVPVVYELFRIKRRSWATQLFLLGVDNQNNIYLCDHEVGRISKYKLRVIQQL